MQEKGGPLETDNLFCIGGDAIDTKQGQKNFLESVYWAPGEPGVLELRRYGRRDNKACRNLITPRWG